MKASSKGGSSQVEHRPQAAKEAGKEASGAKVGSMYISLVMPAESQANGKAPQCWCESQLAKPLSKEFDFSSVAMECI